MKYLILFILFFTVIPCLGQTYDVVFVKHIGETDKPIPSLIVFNENKYNKKFIKSLIKSIDGESLKIIATDSNFIDILFNKRKELIQLENQNKMYPFGSFRFTFYSSMEGKSITYGILGDENSRYFFNSVLELMMKEKSKKKNNELISELINIVKRISY